MPQKFKPYTTKSNSVLKFDEVEWKSANLSGISLEGILVVCYDDKLMDQLFITEWDANNEPISSHFYFSGYIYYHIMLEC